jgi:hypothetical protein
MWAAHLDAWPHPAVSGQARDANQSMTCRVGNVEGRGRRSTGASLSIFGDIDGVLIEHRLVERTQLLAAKGHQRRFGRTLAQAAIDLGFIPEEALYANLGAITGVPYVRIGDRVVPRDVLRRVPERLVQSRRVLPLLDPLDLSVLYELAFASGMPVRGVLASPRDIDQAIARLLSGSSAFDVGLAHG